ncbi:MAG TPA: MmcQ/YjbR family DNA-binding protein [Solirubrobacteraceae bacterium]|nr:MmcQ/YjbR family DNA-binding protein [Solirubrobacteraceae bacterium]
MVDHGPPARSPLAPSGPSGPGSADAAAAERARAAVWARCEGQRGAWLDRPFGPETAVFKVAGRIFALVSAQTPARVSLKCEPAFGAALRENHPAIAAGYHLDKRHWITITLDGSVEGDLLDDLVDGSYDLVVAKLSKRAREEIAGRP